MEKFEFKIDLQTPYIKAIRFLGATLFGFFIAAIFFSLKFEGTVDWMNAISGVMCALVFALFPGAAKKQSLTIDDTGIFLHNYTFRWGQASEIKWEKVRAVGLQKHTIHIKNSIGSTEKIKLPLHTKEQLKELKTYLQELTKVKGLEYIS